MPGAGLYEVGSGKTYASPKAAIEQLRIDQGTAPFEATQTIRIFGGTYGAAVNDGDGILTLDGEGSPGAKTLHPTAANRLVVEGIGSVVFDCETTVKAAIYCYTPYTDISGITGRNGNWYGIYIGDSTGTNQVFNVTVKNCVFHGSINRHGIILAGVPTSGGGPYGCTIQNNVCYDCLSAGNGAAGIALWYGCKDNTIQGNTCYTNYIGIVSIPGSDTTLGAYNERNVAYDNILYTNTIDGIQNVDNTTTAHDPGLTRIERNYIYNNGRSGIYGWNVGNGSIIANNIITNHTASWAVGLYYTRFMVGTLIYNNTFYGNGTGVWSQYCTNTTLRNNIFMNHTVRGVLFDSDTTPSCNYSAYFGNTLDGNNDAVKVTTDPFMKNPAGGDFTLTTPSPCINAGADVSGAITNDFARRTRPYGSAFDIGAYEFYPVIGKAGQLAGRITGRVAGRVAL